MGVIPLAEYLGQTYHPDRDYVEGHLQERHGEKSDIVTPKGGSISWCRPNAEASGPASSSAFR